MQLKCAYLVDSSTIIYEDRGDDYMYEPAHAVPMPSQDGNGMQVRLQPVLLFSGLDRCDKLNKNLVILTYNAGSDMKKDYEEYCKNIQARRKARESGIEQAKKSGIVIAHKMPKEKGK